MNTSVNYATFIIIPDNHKRNSNRHKRMYKDNRKIDNEDHKQDMRNTDVQSDKLNNI